MKISKSYLKQIIKEEIENLDPDGDSDDQAELRDMIDDLEELVDDFDVDPTLRPEDAGSFFLTLARKAGNFLPNREQEIAQEMKDACVEILLSASSNRYEGKFPSRR